MLRLIQKTCRQGTAALATATLMCGTFVQAQVTDETRAAKAASEAFQDGVQRAAENTAAQVRQGVGDAIRRTADQIQGRPAGTDGVNAARPTVQTQVPVQGQVTTPNRSLVPIYDSQGRQMVDQFGRPMYSQRIQTQNYDQAQPQTLQQNRPDARTVTGQQAGQRNMQANQSRQPGTPMNVALLEKMKLGNEAEIELAEMAKQKATSDDVKQYAGRVIEDHRALTQDIEKQLQKSQNQSNPAGSSTPTVPQKLVDIGKQVCEKNLQMTKGMLQSYEGQDFQMAFLGQQVVAHTAMLSELEVLSQQGPQEIRDIASKAKEKVSNHLERAKQLAKQLEGDYQQNNAGNESENS